MLVSLRLRDMNVRWRNERSLWAISTAAIEKCSRSGQPDRRTGNEIRLRTSTDRKSKLLQGLLHYFFGARERWPARSQNREARLGPGKAPIENSNKGCCTLFFRRATNIQLCLFAMSNKNSTDQVAGFFMHATNLRTRPKKWEQRDSNTFSVLEWCAAIATCPLYHCCKLFHHTFFVRRQIFECAQRCMSMFTFLMYPQLSIIPSSSHCGNDPVQIQSSVHRCFDVW